jgi:hypothetical protein
MQLTSNSRFRKATFIPIDHVNWQLELQHPFQVFESLHFENVKDVLKPELFTLWREMISQRDRDLLSSMRFALVHRFESSGHIGREEAESDDFAFKVFLCLLLIKPTKSSFQRVQVKYLENGELEVFSFSHPTIPWPNIPESESLNVVELGDIQRLRSLLPAFLSLAADGPENIRRAIRHFNVGYSELRDPTTQIVVWTMGIEALFADEQKPPLSPSALADRIGESIGLETDIYDLSPMREYIGDKRFGVGDLLNDLLTLRDRFVHGQWTPPGWKTKTGRNGLGGPIYYADVLREVAAFILRRGILNYLENRRKESSP